MTHTLNGRIGRSNLQGSLCTFSGDAKKSQKVCDMPTGCEISEALSLWYQMLLTPSHWYTACSIAMPRKQLISSSAVHTLHVQYWANARAKYLSDKGVTQIYVPCTTNGLLLPLLLYIYIYAKEAQEMPWECCFSPDIMVPSCYFIKQSICLSIPVESSPSRR